MSQLAYPSRFVELGSTSVHFNDEKYPPDYEQATSNVDAASVRAPPSSANASTWSGQFGDASGSPDDMRASISSNRRPLPSSPIPRTPSTQQRFGHQQRQSSVSHLTTATAGTAATSAMMTVTSLRNSGNGNGNKSLTHGASTQYEWYVYTYRLVAAGMPVQCMISVESATGLPTQGRYSFKLSMKINGIERPLGDAVEKNLRVDPRQLDFVVFVFPGKTSLPAGCLWSLRVWLRVNGVDHRLFGEDELWMGRDPDFNSIGDASFARLKHHDSHEQVSQAYVGKALVLFTVKWVRVQGSLYKYSLEYEAGGVGGMLFEDFRMKLDNDPRSIFFLIFTVPSNSIPAGASHKLRVWIRSQVPSAHTDPAASYVLPFNDSFIYQRAWKTDDFKLGAHLQFESLGPKMVMGFAVGGPEVVQLAHPPYAPSGDGRGVGRGSSLGSVDEAKGLGFDF